MAKSRESDRAYRVFEVSLGWCGVCWNARGVCGFVLPLSSADATETAALRMCGEATRRDAERADLVKAVDNYFDGWRTAFDDYALDLSGGTPFQQRVWSIVRRIPYGTVRTYRWVGMEMGQPDAVRAIGNALGANPVPLLVPCHRVVASDGRLGGFSAEGGLKLKLNMLEMERVRFVKSGDDYRILA